MSRSLRPPVLGTLAAIAVTATMDATGYAPFSALPLLPLGALFWYLQRLPRREVGFTWGRLSDYAQPILHPVLVIGAAALAAYAGGAVDLEGAEWSKFWLNLVVGGLATILGCIVTEEGFFRGWLWASLRRAGRGKVATLVWTSAAFSLWHLSAVILPTGFDLPLRQVPVYLINATLIGAIWGVLRLASGSVVVASVAHGVWNGLAYALFAFGTKVGTLGVTETWLYGPEVGLLGLGLNALYATWLLRRYARFLLQSPANGDGEDRGGTPSRSPAQKA